MEEYLKFRKAIDALWAQRTGTYISCQMYLDLIDARDQLERVAAEIYHKEKEDAGA